MMSSTLTAVVERLRKMAALMLFWSKTAVPGKVNARHTSPNMGTIRKNDMTTARTADTRPTQCTDAGEGAACFRDAIIECYQMLQQKSGSLPGQQPAL
jgi:hypothetical protein